VFATQQVQHSVYNTVTLTQCLQLSVYNSVFEHNLRTHQLDAVFQHSVLGCCQKHCFTGQWLCGLDSSFGTDCICCLLPTLGWRLACGQCLVLTAQSCRSRPPPECCGAARRSGHLYISRHLSWLLVGLRTYSAYKKDGRDCLFEER
jgi:hypothetical protein